MRASIVIPTYNRLQDLQQVISAVESQERPPGVEIEIVVVDDGSTDGTPEWLRTVAGRPDFTALEQANSGPARARNRGVEGARGEIILFLGDDTEPQPGWLLAHLEEHRLFAGEGPLAVLGYTSFPPGVDSPFLRWINEYGAQFGYLLIDSPRAVPFNFFYTSNISLPRSLLIGLRGFREDFPAAAWEDIEFAYRAGKEGLRLRYQPRARTLHHHRIRPRTFCRRQRTSGLSAAIFSRLHPELEEFLGVARIEQRAHKKPVRRWLLGLLVGFGERLEGVVPARAYREYLDLCYLEGLAEGLHQS
ncbi:MAG: glycosyltransferase family 2 protein [Acidobacteria bacterium]|nr:glycosyltransferase family 2 protein [Acidobacteriota bacterium]